MPHFHLKLLISPCLLLWFWNPSHREPGRECAKTYFGSKKEKYSHGEKAALEWQEFFVAKNLKYDYLIIYQKC